MAEFNFRPVLNLGLLASAIFFAALGTVNAQETESDWWFDIEFIAFKRDMLPGHPEDFNQTDYVFSDDTPFDLFTIDLFRRANPTFRLAAALPNCDPNKQQTSIEDLKLEPFDADALIDQARSFTSLDLKMTETAMNPLEELLIDLGTAQFIAQQQFWLGEPLPALPALDCTNELAYEAFNRVPQRYFAKTPYRFGQHRTLANESTFLDAFSKRVFAQREITPLIYTAWRQPVVFGENNAEFYRIFAGERLSISKTLETPSSSATAAPIEDTVSASLPESARTNFIINQMTKLENALISEQPVTWDVDAVGASEKTREQYKGQSQWELDGLFKVYLDYVNRVPYLHVDSEFKHARIDIDASGHPVINNYPSKQRRRIISKQIHYFDHPAFGIIIRLERYQVPAANQTDAASNQN